MRDAISIDKTTHDKTFIIGVLANAFAERDLIPLEKRSARELDRRGYPPR
jgi:hypothetical protein